MKKSFTLTEVIVALGVFGIGVLGVSGFFATSSQTVKVGRMTTTASNLAQGVIDEELTQSYDALIVGNGSKTRFSADTNDPFYVYQKQVNVSYIDSNLNNSGTDLGLKKIEVFVYWPSGNTEKNIQMATIITRR